MSNSNQPPIHFVISAPRSGSTWLTTALNGHPEIFATEHRLFGDFAEIWKNNDGSSSPRLTLDSYAKAMAVHYFYRQLGLDRDQFADVFLTEFVKFIVDFALQRSNARIVIDKITPYAGTANLVVSKIRELFPKSKIIHLVRDGRDVVTSGTFDWLLKDSAGTDRYRYFVERDPGVQLTRFFDDQVLTKWTNHWRESIEVFEAIPADLQISYEAMKADQGTELEKIFALLGITHDRSVAQVCAQSAKFETMSGRPAGIDLPTGKARKGVVGDWRNFFTRIDAELFVKLAGPQLRELGYEFSDDWLDLCPGFVVPPLGGNPD